MSRLKSCRFHFQLICQPLASRDNANLRDTIQSFRGPDAKRLVVEVRREKFVSRKWLNFLFHMQQKLKIKEVEKKLR
jgi:hypothetical protein